jgi:hypothetical protein
VVFRLENDRFAPVGVKVGAGTVGKLVITSGIAVGDRIALRDPTVSADVAALGTSQGVGAGGSGAGDPGAPAAEDPAGGEGRRRSGRTR